MNEKKADKPRYWVTYLLKDLPVGTTFKPDLLHLTIIPWFVADLDEKKIIESFHKNFADQAKFEVTVGKVGEFKHKRKIHINFIEPSPEILDLHAKALGWFSSLDARWAVKTPHVSEEYIPHIRRRPGHNLTAGKKVHLSSLSLVRARRRGDDFRMVVARIEFDGKA